MECLSARTLDCTGCHFQAPFRAACDQGCMSLYRLFPDEVLGRVLEKLGLGQLSTTTDRLLKSEVEIGFEPTALGPGPEGVRLAALYLTRLAVDQFGLS